MFETINKLSIKAYSGCNLHCCYCVSGDTQITMSDLTTKPIKDIKIGDEIVAFNEISEKNKQRKLKTAKVTHVFNPRYVEKLYQINTKLGNKLLITGEHPILDGRNQWTTAEKLINKKEKKIKSVKLPKFNITNNFDNNYKIGYIISCFLGDGLIRTFLRGNSKSSDMRFVVKDDEINHRMKQFLNDINFHFNLINFCISKKYKLIKEGIRNNTYSDFIKFKDLIDNNLNKNTNENYLKGFLAGIYDCEGSYGKDKQLRISNGNTEIIQQIKTALDYFGYKYTFNKCKTNVNIQIYDFRLLEKSINDFLMNICPACSRKKIKYENYSPIRIDDIKSIKEIDFNDYVYNIETTEHTYIANNILVHNCHQLGEYKYHAQEFQDFQNLEKLLMILPFEDRVDVTITGGEITLRPDCFMNVAKVFKKVERIRDVKFELCVVTNGTNMDVVYDWCDRKIICPHKTAISWDGIYSASKSRLTKGKYNDEFFKNVIKKLGTTKYNHDICVTPAITPMTLPDLAESYKFCLENNVFNFGYYFIHEANYHGVEFANEFRKQLTEIAKLYLEYSNKGEELYYYNWQLIYTKRKMPKNFFLCSKLGNNYHIDINGDIYPCIYFGDHKIFKVGSLTDGINEEKLKQFEKEFLVLPLCNHRKCGNLQCTECPASNLVHNKSLSKRFCNLCSILPIETQIYDEYASQISSLFKHDSLYIPKDEYMRGSKMFDNLHLEENAVFHTETGINSPAYNGVRKW